MGPWFPTWLLVAMSLMYAAIATTHLAHAAHQRGRALLWTSAHTLMAIGMLVMVLPTDRMVVSGTPMVLAFLAAAAGCLVIAVRAVRTGVGSGLWFTAAIDLGAMAYMFTPMSSQTLVVSLLLAVVIAVEAAYWASGYFLELAERDGLARRPAVEDGGPTSAPEAGTTRGVTVSVRTRPADGPAARALSIVHRAHSSSLRISMCLMALGMAYMLVGMTLGVPTTAGGGHVHG